MWFSSTWPSASTVGIFAVMRNPSLSRVQQCGKKDLFDCCAFARQTFLVGVAKKHFQHRPIGTDAKRKRIVAENCRLMLAITGGKIQIREVGELSTLICGLFALAENTEKLGRKPGVFLEQ